MLLIFHFNYEHDHHVLPQWATIRPEDSGVYICKAVNKEGVTEIKVDITVEGGLGAPVASVSAAEVTAVEGRLITMECQATGKMLIYCFCINISFTSLTANVSSIYRSWQVPQLLSSAGPSYEHRYHGNTQWLVVFWHWPVWGAKTQASTSVMQPTFMATVWHTRRWRWNVSGQNPFINTETVLYLSLPMMTILLPHAAPPYATCLPDKVRLPPGDAVRIKCLAHGSHPIRFEWSRVGRANLPAGSETTQDGTLLIAHSKLVDSGTYKCVASNHIGSSEALAKVIIKGGLLLEIPASLHLKLIHSPNHASVSSLSFTA